MKTVIAGREYNLRSDNERVLQLAADLVNSEMENLEKMLPGESQATVAVLSALNIAEKYYLVLEQSELDKDFLKDELRRMTEQLDIQMRNA